MLRWSSIVVPIAVYLAAGIVLPIGVLVWLQAHHEPPYVLESESIGSARSALGGRPIALRPVSGVLDVIADGGTTADYADGSTATMVRASRPSQVVAKYGSSLPEKSATSSTAGGFTQRDATLSDGRVARTIGTSGFVFAFIAPSVAALDRAVAHSALRPNAKRDVGNAVLDDRAGPAMTIGIGWFAAASLLAGLTIARALKSFGA
ncbi:MAG: hypothetical protein JWO85_1388 [Candidatus Eremiobacteraeota bacterium]|nr:hypothetical protein [Candidatus Eremiobacteraeota bacterium]